MISQFKDGFTDLLAAGVDAWKEVSVAKNANQVSASPSQYNQQLPAVDATGRPITQQPGAVQSWLMANWMVVVLLIVLVILAYKFKWI